MDPDLNGRNEENGGPTSAAINARSYPSPPRISETTRGSRSSGTKNVDPVSTPDL
jgi:hypothetical protein